MGFHLLCETIRMVYGVVERERTANSFVVYSWNEEKSTASDKWNQLVNSMISICKN